jgi:hypothetical protein
VLIHTGSLQLLSLALQLGDVGAKLLALARGWRNQPYGPRANPTYKEIWIDGVFINAEDCTDAERSEARIKARVISSW